MKRWGKRYVIFAVIGLALSGCGGNSAITPDEAANVTEERLNQELEGTVKYPAASYGASNMTDKPPALRLQDALSSTYSKFEVLSGNYTWYCKTGNEEEMTGGIACGFGPLDEAKEKTRLKLPRYNKMDFVSYTVSWEEMPDDMTMEEYDIADLGNIEAKALTLITYDEIFAVELKPDRVYEISAEWKEERVGERGFYGNASYVVVTE